MNPGHRPDQTFLGSTLAIGCLMVGLTLFADTTSAAAEDSHAGRVEERIRSLHGQLGIAGEQEAAWSAVAGAMRDDAKSLDALTQSRHDHAGNMTAIEDLKSYSAVTDAHAQGLHKLTEAFGPLYESFSPEQKRKADSVFRMGSHAMQGHQKTGSR